MTLKPPVGHHPLGVEAVTPTLPEVQFLHHLGHPEDQTTDSECGEHGRIQVQAQRILMTGRTSTSAGWCGFPHQPGECDQA